MLAAHCGAGLGPSGRVVKNSWLFPYSVPEPEALLPAPLELATSSSEPAASVGAGGYLTEPVGAVEDCQVCPRQTLGAACLTILGSWSISIRSKATRLCEAAASA